MGWFGMDSTSTTAADYAAAADQAVLPYKSKDFQLGTTNIGKSATVNAGGIQVQKGAVGSKGSLSVTVNDPNALMNMASMFSGALEDVSTSSGNAVSSAVGGMKDALAGFGNNLQEALKQLGAVGADTASGGDASRNKIVLYVVLAVLALVGLVFYFKR